MKKMINQDRRPVHELTENTQKWIKHSAVAFCLLATVQFNQTTAQELNSTVLKWTAFRVSETASVAIRNNPGSIVTFQMSRVEIRDKDGVVLKTYKLSNPDGDLTSASQDGRIRYRAIGSDGKPGIFLIDRREGASRILISFSGADMLPKEQHYDISSVEVIQ